MINNNNNPLLTENKKGGNIYMHETFILAYTDSVFYRELFIVDLFSQFKFGCLATARDVYE